LGEDRLVMAGFKSVVHTPSERNGAMYTLIQFWLPSQ
jgi:hypothetical protein